MCVQEAILLLACEKTSGGLKAVLEAKADPNTQDEDMVRAAVPLCCYVQHTAA